MWLNHTLSNILRSIGWLALKQSIRTQFSQVQHLSTTELANWLNNPASTQPILLDTRTSEEYAVSHLPNARWLDPSTQEFAGLDLPLATPIVTYCSVGYRSARITDRLQSAGYTHVINLEGSIFQWANEQKPIYREGQQVKQVHPYNALWGQLLDSDLHAYEPQ